MSQFWLTFFASLASTAIAIAALGFLCKAIVVHFFNVHLEKLRTELKKESTDYDLRSTAWHTQKIKVTQRIYTRAQRCHILLKDAIWRYSGAEESDEFEKARVGIFSAVHNFERYILVHKAYIDDDLHGLVEEFLHIIDLVARAFVRAEHLRITGEAFDRPNQENEAQEKFQKLVPPALGKIETRMRANMLG